MSTFTDNRRRHAASWITLLAFVSSSVCSAQTTGVDEQPGGVTAPMPITAPGRDAPAMPRSRRVLTADEFSTLVGNTLSLSVRDRWPRRVVKGTILSVTTDAVSVDTGKAIRTLPIARTVVTTRLPGDFIELVGRKITVSGRRRLPPREITGIVVSVDAAHVNVDSGGQLHRVPIAGGVILSRTPDRDRRRALIAAVAVSIGSRVWLLHKCRSGGC